MGKLLLMTAHGLEENPDERPVADVTGLTRRLGYRPSFCTRLYPDDLAKSWAAAWVATPRHTDVTELFWVDEADAVPIDAWHWSQHGLDGHEATGDERPWNEDKERSFCVDGVTDWQREYLVREIPDKALRFHADHLTHELPTFVSGLLRRNDAVPADMRESFLDVTTMLRDQMYDTMKRAYDDLDAVTPTEWYDAFVKKTGVFAFLWSLASKRTFHSWYFMIAPETFGPSFMLAQVLREHWAKSCGMRGEGAFGREDLDAMGKAVHEMLDESARSIARGWLRDAAGNVGRNDPCPCGSGVKLKRCHGNVRGMEWLIEHPFDGSLT